MIAKKPSMGWNSWDCFGAAVKEQQVLENARYMQQHMKQYGWEYVVVDIEWYQPTASSHEYEPFSDLVMDEYGRLLPDETRFPSAKGGRGFQALASQIHDMGLKFGIHIMRGMPRMAAHKDLPIKGSNQTARQVANPNSICAWNPDMYGLKCDKPGAAQYYQSIFDLYASWGVDFVKVDDIAREYPQCEKEIELISYACRNCGRDMVLSLSPGPAPLEQAEHLKKYANMWRITDDFWDDWKALLAMFERAEKWCIHAGPGHWPDADMLPVGALRQCYIKNTWTNFTREEQVTMMTLWCMLHSPLIVGGHLPKNDEFTLHMLTNKEVLEIEEQSYCAHPLYRNEDEAAWIAPFMGKIGCYVAVFNLSDKPRDVSFSLEDYGLEYVTKAEELWSRTTKVLGENRKETINETIAPHGAVVYKLQ